MKPVEIVIKYRSFVGIIGLIVILYLSTPSPNTLTIGFFFIIAGMFFRGWSAGYINKDNELATHGPYSLTRNPLYFGNFILGVGIAIAGNNIYCYAIFLGYYLLFFPFLMIIEHKRLKLKFGQKYVEWHANSNSFFPKLKSPKDKSKRKRHLTFNISFYMKNKEYKVLYFSLFIIAVLILKVLKSFGNFGNLNFIGWLSFWK
ncbi:MAG: isoprenylcysteine carboxylmethyltransferase family protein [bacterium]|nr:isoprenylcysteine carboxylmethyltransferase family protein [bacterium]